MNPFPHHGHFLHNLQPSPLRFKRERGSHRGLILACDLEGPLAAPQVGEIKPNQSLL